MSHLRGLAASMGLSRASLGRGFAAATLMLICGAFVLNNLGPYLGLGYAGAMTMYSGLSGGGVNHVLVPRIRLSEANGYVSVLHADAARDRGAAGVRLFRELQSDDAGERPQIHLNLVRYQASRLCKSAPGLRLELTLLGETGQRIELENACAEPAFLRYDLLSSYPPCRNHACRQLYEEWQASLVSRR